MSYKYTFTVRRLWAVLAVTVAVSFAVLLLFGGMIYQQAPPLPDSVRTNGGEVVLTGADVLRGRQVWQSMGGMELGSIWGHGSYLAPDWTADWLHREAMALADIFAQRKYGSPFDRLAPEEQSYIRVDVTTEMRRNTYSEADGRIAVSTERATAMNKAGAYYHALFSRPTSAEYAEIREQMAIADSLDLAAEDVRALNAFFFWTAWGATTNRPGKDLTYTSNWPHEPMVGNTPTVHTFIWTFFSIIFLLAGIASLCWYYVRQFDLWRDDLVPEGGVATSDAFANVTLTPSMQATIKYFAVVAVLILAQIGLGAATAHYAVEGQEFYGFPLAEIVPYTLTRTWHVQAALFWIATSWLAAGLFLAPLISGHEPKFQRLGVNFLFVSLLIIVAGSFAGQWLGVQQVFEAGDLNFWFGHQGYEYVDLGRFWQIYLFVGLLLWLLLMARALLPALRQGGQSYHLLLLLFLSTVAIGLLYGAGLFWDQTTSLSMIEYWRWWVVHLWVEGVFEVFATAIIAVLFVRIGLLRPITATVAVLFATFIFLAGGVLGTFHHLYWTGTPIGVLALGGVFSALEVVPLVVIGFEAYGQLKVERLASGWIKRYHWPLMFLMAVAFWNLVGAGLLGFLINTPMALYYMQGLNTTPLHGHAALFGVYGMLGIGLLLFCLCIATDKKFWNDRLLKVSFWSFNLGLGAMLLFSLLPLGLLQAIESYSVSYWSARTPEFMHQPLMEAFVWARVPGDIIFAVGILSLLWFLVKLYRGYVSSRAGY